MRIALVTESARPCSQGVLNVWGEDLVKGMPGRDFVLHVLEHGSTAVSRERPLPENVRGVHTAAMGEAEGGRGGAPLPKGRRARAYREHHAELVRALAASGADCPAGSPPTADTPPAGRSGTASPAGTDVVADRFCSGLYGLAALAREEGDGAVLGAFLRSDIALDALEAACRARGAAPEVAARGLTSLLAAADLLARALRPLSAPWYADAGTPGSLAAADLCHVLSVRAPALPGLLAARWFGTPLLVTEYGAGPRGGCLADGESPHGTGARALVSAFHRLLAAETYRRASLVTPGNTRDRRWQERCGAVPERIRTVYPGIPEAETEPLVAAEGEPLEPTLVWVGRPDPAKDLVGLLHAFAELRVALPEARLRIIDTGEGGAQDYAARCRTLAAQLFPDEAPDARSVGESPVTFETVGTPEVPELGDAYVAGGVVVLSSSCESFPRTLVEAMFSGRATVSTDTGAVREVIGGTGLVVPPRNPRALADACLKLLGDRERRERLGAAARERARELFTARQNVAAFDRIYLELVAHCPAVPSGAGGSPRPFDRPAEARLPGRWASAAASGGTGSGTRWVPGRERAGCDVRVKAASGLPGWAARDTDRAADDIAAPVSGLAGGVVRP